MFGEPRKNIASPGVSFKSEIPCGVNIPWFWIVCFCEEAELEFEPAEVGFGASSSFGWNMALIFFRREVLLPDRFLELVSGEFTVASFCFVVVIAFDLAESSQLCVEVLVEGDEGCLCCKE